MITREDIDVDTNIDTDEQDPPWADTDCPWDEDLLEAMGDDFAEHNISSTEMAKSLRKDAWLEKQDVTTTLLVGCDDVIGIDPDGGRDHNVHVYTDFEVTASQMGLTEDSNLGDIVGYHTLTYRISTDTDYRITNKRLVTHDGDQTLVLTLAPEE